MPLLFEYGGNASKSYLSATESRSCYYIPGFGPVIHMCQGEIRWYCVKRRNLQRQKQVQLSESSLQNIFKMKKKIQSSSNPGKESLSQVVHIIDSIKYGCRFCVCKVNPKQKGHKPAFILNSFWKQTHSCIKSFLCLWAHLLVLGHIE